MHKVVEVWKRESLSGTTRWVVKVSVDLTTSAVQFQSYSIGPRGGVEGQGWIGFSVEEWRQINDAVNAALA